MRNRIRRYVCACESELIRLYCLVYRRHSLYTDVEFLQITACIQNGKRKTIVILVLKWRQNSLIQGLSSAEHFLIEPREIRRR